MRVNNSGKFNVQSMSEVTTHRNSTIQGCFTEQDRARVWYGLVIWIFALKCHRKFPDNLPKQNWSWEKVASSGLNNKER